MKIVIFAALIILTGAIGIQLYRLYGERAALVREAQRINDRVKTMSSENKSISEDIEYLSSFDNLVKELKSLFNYRRPGEKLYIIVPSDKPENIVQ